jgi:hypothetical protein
VAESDFVDVIVRGEKIRLKKRDVLRAIGDGSLGIVRQHAVEIRGQLYPVKEVFARASGLELLDFNTTQARSALHRLGFELRTVRPLGHRRQR